MKSTSAASVTRSAPGGASVGGAAARRQRPRSVGAGVRSGLAGGQPGHAQLPGARAGQGLAPGTGPGRRPRAGPGARRLVGSPNVAPHPIRVSVSTLPATRSGTPSRRSPLEGTFPVLFAGEEDAHQAEYDAIGVGQARQAACKITVVAEEVGVRQRAVEGIQAHEQAWPPSLARPQQPAPHLQRPSLPAGQPKAGARAREGGEGRQRQQELDVDAVKPAAVRMLDMPSTPHHRAARPRPTSGL